MSDGFFGGNISGGFIEPLSRYICDNAQAISIIIVIIIIVCATKVLTPCECDSGSSSKSKGGKKKKGRRKKGGKKKKGRRKRRKKKKGRRKRRKKKGGFEGFYITDPEAMEGYLDTTGSARYCTAQSAGNMGGGVDTCGSWLENKMLDELEGYSDDEVEGGYFDSESDSDSESEGFESETDDDLGEYGIEEHEFENFVNSREDPYFSTVSSRILSAENRQNNAIRALAKINQERLRRKAVTTDKAKEPVPWDVFWPEWQRANELEGVANQPEWRRVSQ